MNTMQVRRYVVIQKVLESEGNFTLLDKNKVIEQHDFLEYLNN